MYNMNTAKEDVFDITPPAQEMTREDAVSNIFKLEKAIAAEDGSFGFNKQDEDGRFKYKHWFAPNLYGREITMPDDLVLTTEIHATEHIAIISKGAVTVYSEQGVEYHEAPFTMITKIGTKRAMLTHGEVVFTTIHHNPTNETDLVKLEKIMTFSNEADYQKYLEVDK